MVTDDDDDDGDSDVCNRVFPRGKSEMIVPLALGSPNFVQPRHPNMGLITRPIKRSRVRVTRRGNSVSVCAYSVNALHTH